MSSESFYLTTDDVGKALKDYAGERNLPAGTVYFELLSTQTLIRECIQEDEHEIRSVAQEPGYFIMTDAALDIGDTLEIAKMQLIFPIRLSTLRIQGGN